MNQFINLNPQQLQASIAKEAAGTYTRLETLLKLLDTYIEQSKKLDRNSDEITDDMFDMTWAFWQSFAAIYELPELKHDVDIMEALAAHYNRITAIQNVKDETKKEPS